jgi:hypothetical protein
MLMEKGKETIETIEESLTELGSAGNMSFEEPSPGRLI